MVLSLNSQFQHARGHSSNHNQSQETFIKNQLWHPHIEMADQEDLANYPKEQVKSNEDNSKI